MKEKIISFLIASILLATPVLAHYIPARSPFGMSRLDLENKDSTWTIINDRTSAEVYWNRFNAYISARGLERKTAYRLIYYVDPWPGTGLKCSKVLYSGCCGYINEYLGWNVAKVLTVLANDGQFDDKIWLVPASDVDCAEGQMTAWNPDRILFETHLI
jgi:hypothetical protein